MIIITGAAGFIGSSLISRLNTEGYTDILIADDFSKKEKDGNLQNKIFAEKIARENLFSWLEKNYKKIDFIFHIGARTNTAEFNKEIFDTLNLGYSKNIWNACCSYQIPLVYASSAATYGLGELGYEDDHSLIPRLKPLNPYGESKNEFDKWVLLQDRFPPFWAGMKFFNVYGPNEYHKGRMASVIFHAFHQIRETGKMKLFRSHHTDCKNGEQRRDFIYVKDVVDVLLFFMFNQVNSGIFNLGTGKARTFLDLVRSTFLAMDMKEKIEFIDIPEDIRDTYQYFTQAKINKLIDAGYILPFSTLEQGIDDYVRFFLQENRYL